MSTTAKPGKKKEPKGKKAATTKKKGKKDVEEIEEEVEEIEEEAKQGPGDELGDEAAKKTGARKLEDEEDKYAVFLEFVTEGYGLVRIKWYEWFKGKEMSYVPLLGRAIINTRPITEGRKKQMLDSYISQGILRGAGKALKTAMDRDWYEGGLAPGAIGIIKVSGEVPWIKFTDAGKKAAEEGRVNPVEGLGRRSGAEAYIEMMVTQRTAELKKLARLKRVGNGEGREKEIAECERMIAYTSSEAEHASWWPIRVLNLSE